MEKRKYVDIAVILLLGYYIVTAVNSHFNEGSVLSLNFLFGVLGWMFGVYKLIKGNHRYGILILLLLSVFNVVVFKASISSFGQVYFLYKGDSINIASIGINPLQLFISVIYSVFNWAGVYKFFNIIVGYSKVDEASNYKLMVDFYYDKFNSCSDDELTNIFKNYRDYPLEAQEAILQLKDHRGFGYDPM